MPPKEKKRGSRALAPDILSNLPDNIIDAIVMRLPLRDAVRTSILSKMWRYNWCRLPVWTIDQAFWDMTNNAISPTTRFTNIIFHLLTLHVGPISKFTLSVATLGNCSKIDNLMYFLSRNGIQHLVLQFPRGNLYKLPSSFFTCSQISHLSLQNCLIMFPPAFKGFEKLVSLELCDVTIPSKFIGSLISCCPSLEHLVLHSTITNHIQIRAPKLKSFDFTGKLIFLSLEGVPLLEKLSLVDTGYSGKAGKCGIAKLLESFPALKHLHLDYFSVRVYDDWVEPAGGDVTNEILEKVNSLSDVTLNHLRVVHFAGITGTDPEMQLIKFLLAKSPMLTRMLIKPSVGDDTPKSRIEVLAEITQFRRALPRAEVVYKLS